MESDDTKQLSSPFLLVEESLVSSSPEIPLDPAWVMLSDPTLEEFRVKLNPPSYLRIYECQENIDISLEELGKAAQETINEHLADHGAILFRNLQNHIPNATAFARFWNGCCDNSTDWKPTTYMSFGHSRKTLEGVDLATNIPPDRPLSCHSELMYNPRPPSRIAFYCLQEAIDGGETILSRNYTDYIPEDIKALVREKGGCLYIREHPDENNLSRSHHDKRNTAISTWQDKAGTKDREEAVEFFCRHGFDRKHIQFDENGTMRLEFFHPGFTMHQGKELFYNLIGIIPVTKQPKDGTPYPTEIEDRVRIERMKSVTAFKMRRGDWLMLDNMTVLHGRLPYRENPKGMAPRTLLTVYTE